MVMLKARMMYALCIVVPENWLNNAMITCN
jgi:hypothetical protein